MLRVLEIVAAVLLLIVLLPFFVVAVLLVQIDSPGPVIFRQRRVGRGGREFTLYKLRTMRRNANGSYPPHTQVNDVRFSPLCRFIRATCIDEVPQLWNIIKGDMGFVGPRPELPNIVRTYDDEQKNVLKYKPGLLGISQLVLREGVDYKKKLKIENKYYPNRTFLKDALIVAATPFVIMDNALSRVFAPSKRRLEYTDTPWFKFLMGINGDNPFAPSCRAEVDSHRGGLECVQGGSSELSGRQSGFDVKRDG